MGQDIAEEMLATISDAAEIVVTEPATRARATVPVRPAGS